MASVTIERRGRRQRIIWREGGRKSKRHVETFPNLPQAEARAKVLRAQLAAQTPARVGRSIAWDELVQRYLLSRPETSKAHRDKVQTTLLALGKARGWDYTADVTLATTENLKPYHARVLRAFLNYAIDLDQQVNQRVIRQRRPKGARTQGLRPLTDEEVLVDIATATKWHPADGAIAHIVATYGHRVESLVDLRVCAVDAAGLFLVLKVKSGDTKPFPVIAATIERLAPLIVDKGPNDHVFVGHLGRPWRSGKEFSAWWGHCVVPPDPARQGKRLRGHGIVAMRKYATTRLYRACKDAKAVADIQGRRTPGLVLQIYAQSDDASRRAVLTSAYPSVPPGATH